MFYLYLLVIFCLDIKKKKKGDKNKTSSFFKTADCKQSALCSKESKLI